MGEPDVRYRQRTVWWKWTAPGDGLVSISFHSPQQHSVALYSGTSLTDLSNVDLTSSGFTAYEVKNGVTYYIVVYGSYTEGAFTFQLQYHAPPQNDQFENYIALPSDLAVSGVGSTIAASSEPGEPDHDGAPAKHSIWWAWTAPSTGPVQITSGSVDGSSALFDTGVYTGAALVDLVDKRFFTRYNITYFQGRAGVKYYLAFDSDSKIDTSIIFNLIQTPVVNDDFSQAIDMGSEASFTVRGAPFLSTLEPGEEGTSGSIWWKWTAPSDGGLFGWSQFEGNLYTGASLADLNEIDMSQPGFNGYVMVEEGTTYFLRRNDNLSLSFVADLDFFPASENQHFAGRFELFGYDLTLAGAALRLAKVEGDEPQHLSGSATKHSLWWQWEAPADGALSLISPLNSSVFVYEGDQLSNLTLSGSPSSNMLVKAGVIYNIALVTPYNISPSSPILLSLFPVSENNNFIDAFDLGDSQDAFLTGTGIASNREPGEPSYHTGAGTLWWKWTAPADGYVNLASSQLSSDALQFAVYTGESLGSLSRLTSWQQSGFSNSDAVTVQVLEGVHYRIAAGIPSTHDNQVSAILNFAPDTNLLSADNFEDSIILGAFPVSLGGTLTGTTLQDGEPIYGNISGVGSSWLRLTAPDDGMLEIRFSQKSISTLHLFEGDTLGALTPVPSYYWRDGNIVYRLEQGKPYRIALPGRSRVFLNLDFFPHPVNDAFAQAITLNGPLPIDVPAYTAGASEDPGQPASNLSVWWKWAPDESGWYYIRRLFKQQSIRIYKGDTLETLEEVSSGYVSAQAGSTFYIAIGNTGHNVDVDQRLMISLLGAAPPNDDRSAAESLPSELPESLQVSLLGATEENGEVRHYSENYTGSLWWKWQPLESQLVEIDNINYYYNHQPVLYEELANGDLFKMPRAVKSSETYRFEAGRSYFLVLCPKSTNPSSTQVASLLFLTTPSPENDDFEDAIDLGAVPSGGVSGTLAGATLESFPATRKDVWYRWTAPSDMRLSIGGGDWFHLYKGNLLADLAAIAPMIDGAFRVEAGLGYAFQIDSNRNSSETFSFSWNGVETPANDDFANAIDLGSVSQAEMLAELGSATVEDFENWSSRSVWWKWIAPTDEMLVIESAAFIDVYEGTAPDSLQKIIKNGMGSPSLFRVVEGNTYYIRAVSLSVDLVSVPVYLSQSPRTPNDDFEDAIDLGTATEVVSGVMNTMASTEPFDPVVGQSLWWRWTAPFDAKLRIVDWSVRLFVGDNLQDLVPVPSDHSSVFMVESGAVYHLLAKPGSLPDPKLVRLELSATSISEVASNDNFENRIALNPLPILSFPIGAGTRATSQLNEPTHGESKAKDSRWWEWTAPVTGTYLFGDVGNNYGKNTMAVYTGETLGALVKVVSGKEPIFRGLEGQTYLLIVESVNGDEPDKSLELIPNGGSPSFESRRILDGDPVEVISSTTGGFVEEGEPQHRGIDWTGGSSMWFEWTATKRGAVNVKLLSSVLPVVVDVYQGTDLNSLQSVNAATAQNPTTSFNAIEGETYYVAVVSAAGESGGFRISIGSDGRPPNSSSDTAFDLGRKRSVSTSSSQKGMGAWMYWKWTAPESGFATAKATLNSSMEIYSSLDGFGVTFAVGNPVSFPVSEGQTYFLRMQSYELFGFSIEILPDDAGNNNFVSRFTLDNSSEVQTIHSHNYSADSEAEEPQSGGIPLQSVWWEWSSDVSRRVRLTVDGFANRIKVFRGDSLTGLELVSSGGNTIGFNAEEGTTYQFSIDSDQRLQGEFSLSLEKLSLEESGGNDDFANRFSLAPYGQELRLTNILGSTETGEPTRFSDSLWWTWTAPEDGVFSTEGGFFAVFEGEALETLQFVASNDRIRIFVEAGTVFQIASAGSVDISFGFSRNQPHNDNFADAEDLGETLNALSEESNLKDSSIELQENYPGETNSVWYKWRAPETATYYAAMQVDVLRRIDDVISVFHVNQENNTLGRVTTQTLSSHYDIFSKSFGGVAGQLYYIEVSNEHPDDHAFKLEIAISRIEHDNFANAIPLGSPQSFKLRGSTLGATIEPGEPVHGTSQNENSLWWTWMAPADGYLIPRALIGWSSGDSYLVSLYSKDSFGHLRAVPKKDYYSFAVKGGESYYLALSGNRNDIPFDYNFEFVSPPSNETYLTPESMGANAEVANAQPGWYSWVVPVSGYYVLASGYADGKGPSLYRDHGVSLGVAGILSLSSIMFYGEVGDRFLVECVDTDPSYIQFKLLPSRSNDDIENALVIESVDVSYDVPVAYFSDGFEWWKWTAPHSGAVLLEVKGADLPSRIQVFEGEFSGSLSVTPTLSENVEDSMKSIGFRATAGVTYFIEIQATWYHGSGYELTLRKAPENDDFVNAYDLNQAIAGQAVIDLTGASFELGEPYHGGVQPDRTAWWRWTAPKSGLFSFSAGSIEGAVFISAYCGDFVDRLSPIQSGEGRIFIDAESGVEYQIALGASENLGIVMFEFQAESPTFEEWVKMFLLDENQAALGDPDGDGRNNVVEFFLGGDPGVPDEGYSPVFLSLTGDSSSVVFSYQRRRSATESVVVDFEYSSNLVLWKRLEDVAHFQESVTISADGTEKVSLRIDDAPNDLSKFIRMRLKLKDELVHLEQRIIFDSSVNTLSMEYERPGILEPGDQYIYEFSSDLRIWESIESSNFAETFSESVDGVVTVTAVFLEFEIDTPGYYRIRILRSP